MRRDSADWPLVGFILMIDEFRPDNGATRFVPGSHRWAGLRNMISPMCTRTIPSRCWHVARRAHCWSSTVRHGMVTRRTDPMSLDARCRARSFRAPDALPRTFGPACSGTHPRDSPHWQGRFSRSEARQPFWRPISPPVRDAVVGEQSHPQWHDCFPRAVARIAGCDITPLDWNRERADPGVHERCGGAPGHH